MAITPARERLALNTAPLLLRLMLGLVMLWAGLGKLLDTAEVSGERAATLANMGLFQPPPKVATAPATPPPAATTHEAAPPVAVVPSGPGHYTAADFPDPVKTPRMYLLALTLHDAAFPKSGVAVTPVPPPPAGAPPVVAPPAAGAPMPTWHPSLASGSWPVYFAWALTVIQIGGGACVLLGLFTRFWALGIAAVMLGALWLTHFGPAIQAGSARWGFLPGFAPFDSAAWHPVLFHFVLMMSALALTFAGPGRASLDRVLFGPRGE